MSSIKEEESLMNIFKGILYRSGLNIPMSFREGSSFLRRRESRKNKKTTLALIISALLVVSCGETHMNLEEDKAGASSLVLQMDPKEKEEIVTNQLFEAVLDNRPEEEVEKILSDTNISVTSVNKRRDTPFGVAIQFKQKDKALFLVGETAV